LENEFHLVHKLIELTKDHLDLSFSKNIYFRSHDNNFKLNYLKCFIDEIDHHFFFNFRHFDLIIIFQKLKLNLMAELILVRVL
jgi:hypothetical protein